MVSPPLAQAAELAKTYRSIPLYTTLPADVCDPVRALRIFRKISRHCYLLESADHTGERGRYTFLGYDPTLEVTCTNGQVRLRAGAPLPLTADDPQACLQRILNDHRAPALPGLPPFCGGLVGYFSYDYIKYREPTLNLDAPDEEGFRDVDLMLFDKVIAYDSLQNTIYLIAHAHADGLEENYHAATLSLARMEALLRGGEPAPEQPLSLCEDFTPLFDEAAYCQMVERAKRHIFEGDIFQVVLSNRLAAKAEGSLLGTYRALRESNPSPYMFYLASDDLEIAGASPETLVKLQDGELFTFPLAGTRPRGQDEAEDARLERELLADPKELAEHNMLVDLGRNDLGSVSRFGTVTVEKYMSIERFSHVMHIGSTVRGQIRPDLGALDAIGAVLPAGTLSGAPKIRACQIINELEHNKRGIYGGAIGYIDFSGNMDTCIAIRIAYKKNGRVFVRSGAGIVADSVPEKEYEECLHKMRAVLNALHSQKGGPA